MSHGQLAHEIKGRAQDVAVLGQDALNAAAISLRCDAPDSAAALFEAAATRFESAAEHARHAATEAAQQHRANINEGATHDGN